MIRASWLLAVALVACLPLGAVRASAASVPDGCTVSANYDFGVQGVGSRAVVTFDLATGKAGQRWTYVIHDDGTVIARGTRTTSGAKGALRVTKSLSADHVRDTFTLDARHGADSCHLRARGAPAPETSSCSGRSGFNAGLGADGPGRLKVSIGIDSEHPGQRWTWTLTHDDVRIAAGTSTTTGRGAFEVDRTVPDHRGGDHFTFRAHDAHEHCVIHVKDSGVGQRPALM